jgi:hypothetical protein
MGSANYFHQEIGLTRPRTRYILNQFSIYKIWPIVSQRVVNETASAADFANQYLLHATNPFQNGPSEIFLKACLRSMNLLPSGFYTKLSQFVANEDNASDWYLTSVAKNICFEKRGK